MRIKLTEDELLTIEHGIYYVVTSPTDLLGELIATGLIEETLKTPSGNTNTKLIYDDIVLFEFDIENKMIYYNEPVLVEMLTDKFKNMNYRVAVYYIQSMFSTNNTVFSEYDIEPFEILKEELNYQDEPVGNNNG